MKAAGLKLKKIKTRQVYGFKKDHLIGENLGKETTTLYTTSAIALQN